MKAAPIGATHYMTGEGVTSHWRDLSGPTWKWLDAFGKWKDSEDCAQSFLERNANRLHAVGADRDSAVADAAQWLWLNRCTVTPCMLDRAPGRAIVWAFEAATRIEEARTTIDLDASAWESIKEAASQSPWMPPEYVMNDWVSDVCAFLRNPKPEAAQ